ncbi:Flp family type IVb pilin [Atopobium fossor]|uniref:Flp family type IVb pilin n=1 Tax=Atopobium fossor TaxID=39487 RepID=UPI0004110FD6|nr:Flp family type IVb pilin [Atopobium fossor]
MNNAITWFKNEESGQGLVEYGLIIALIAVVCIAALEAMGTGILGKFTKINEKLQ